MADVLIIAGSKSDEAIVKKATVVLDDLNISYDVKYASAHREPEKVRTIVTNSEAKVMIAIAGLAAALPGVVASHTDKPVIGVPVNVSLDGLDALLSIMQMPKGVPVATVGIDNGQNAAYLASRILGISTKSKTVPKTYAEAGVDETLVAKGLDTLGKYVRESFKYGEVMQDYGHYANTVKVSKDLCLAMSTDGVGSKVLVAEMTGKYDTIGEDCVAMNVNDLICIGATPVGFVDYLASEKPLPEKIIDAIGKGLLRACAESEIPILGGETAILPDMIRGMNGLGLDLAGTAVGIAKPDELFDGSSIQEGDVILGVASNGIHSNGFTLARKVLFSKFSVNDELDWKVTLGEELLRPTRVYVKHFKELKKAGIEIKGLAHITGSGFRKILRLGQFTFSIEQFPEIPSIFELIRTTGDVTWQEMFTTFNMGIGLVVVIPPAQVEKAMVALSKHDNAFQLGAVKKAKQGTVEIKSYGVSIE
ncbi:MAG: phosphoribosylformylglycinamidine cyclo-ligase [Candidatus Thorarchaeota archaeon]|nr:MAG: phosphoribosylformylglycinamidine cyclo-ligase [Candidatus Thorarchaeota archaeon]